MAELHTDPVPPVHDAPIAAGRNVVVVIGIDRYDAWNNLGNAVSDARGTADAFHQLGFVEHPGLLDEDATRDALHALVTDDLRTLGVNDSLVVFFAGHGATVPQILDGAEVNTGYIVPVDAENRDGRVASWIRLDHWLADIARLPPRHILVIIDACHGGVALDAVRTRGVALATARTRDVMSAAEDAPSPLGLRRSRKVIVSALAGQLALDGGPSPGHSLFTGCLLEALTHGLRHRGDTTVSGSEIGLYLQKQLAKYPDARQTPSISAFELDDGGELMVPLARLASGTVPIFQTADANAGLRDRLAAALAEQFSDRAEIRRVVRRAAPRIPATDLPAGGAAMMWGYVLAELTNAGAYSEIEALVAAARDRSWRSRRFDWSVFSALHQPRAKPAVASWSHVEVEILRDREQTGRVESTLITRGQTMLEADVTQRWGGARPLAPRIEVTSNQLFGTRIRPLHQITQLPSPEPAVARWRVEIPVPAARMRTRWVTVRCDGTDASARRYIVAHRGSLCAAALWLACAGFATWRLYPISHLLTLLLLVAAGLVLGVVPPVLMHLLWRVTGQRSFRRILHAWELAAPIVLLVASLVSVLPPRLVKLVTNYTDEIVPLIDDAPLPVGVEHRAVWAWHVPSQPPPRPLCWCGESHCNHASPVLKIDATGGAAELKCSKPAPIRGVEQVAFGCIGRTCKEATEYVDYADKTIEVMHTKGVAVSPLHFGANTASPEMALTADRFSAKAHGVPPASDATLQLPMLPGGADRVAARPLDTTPYELTFTDDHQKRLGSLRGVADTLLRIELDPATSDEPQEDFQILAKVGKVQSTWVGALDQVRVYTDAAEVNKPNGPSIELSSQQGITCRLSAGQRVIALDAAVLERGHSLPATALHWSRACLASGGSLEIGGIAHRSQVKLPEDLPFTHLRVRRSGMTKPVEVPSCKSGNMLRAVALEVKVDRRIEIDGVHVEPLDTTIGVTCDRPRKVRDEKLQCDLTLPEPTCGPIPPPPLEEVDCAIDKSGRIHEKTGYLSTNSKCDCKWESSSDGLRGQASRSGLSCGSFCRCQ
jgi:hypothetical protein